MNDAGARDRLDAGRVVHDRVEKGAFGIARSGMDHQAGRLVDHQQRRVLVDDLQGYGLRLPGNLGELRQVQLDGRTRRDLVRALRETPVEPHVAVTDESLESRSRVVRQQCRQRRIQPFAVECLRYGYVNMGLLFVASRSHGKESAVSSGRTRQELVLFLASLQLKGTVHFRRAAGCRVPHTY